MFLNFFSKTMLRRIFALSMSLTLCLAMVGCGGSNTTSSNGSPANQPSVSPVSQASKQVKLANGKYPVQQATYDDGQGDYRLQLLDTPPGTPSMVEITDLPMAQLTDEEVKAGQRSYLKVENEQPSLHIDKDFKIDYVHNVTETVQNPQTGQRETVVVRQESSFWSPFAGAIAGQIVGNMLFRPQYYVPPIYQPGIPMMGYGGYGSSYGQAVQQYQSRYQAPPAVERNRQVFRSTGRINSPLNGSTQIRRTGSSDRSTGSGYGSSTLRRSNQTTTPRSGSFGSGRRSSVRRR
jgi:hypothetical protein